MLCHDLLEKFSRVFGKRMEETWADATSWCKGSWKYCLVAAEEAKGVKNLGSVYRAGNYEPIPNDRSEEFKDYLVKCRYTGSGRFREKCLESASKP